MKLYFREDDDERCHTKKDIIEDMEENCINKLEIFEAKRSLGESYFWCTINQEIGETGQGCGKSCEDYKPRNGKNGRCCHAGSCYEPTEISEILVINNK